MTLAAEEFVRRFLLHVLPQDFVRIRSFGFLANRGRKDRLARICERIGVAERPRTFQEAGPGAQATPARDPLLCPECESGHLAIVEELEPDAGWKWLRLSWRPAHDRTVADRGEQNGDAVDCPVQPGEKVWQRRVRHPLKWLMEQADPVGRA